MRKWAIVLTLPVIIFMFVGISNAGLNDGLEAYYPFNGNAANEAGTGYDGEVIGATLTDDRLGNPNSAYHFNGNDAIIVREGNPLKEISDDPFSIAVWMKIDNTSATVVGLGNDRRGMVTGEELVTVGVSEGQLSASLTDDVDQNTILPPHMANVTFNEWLHVVMVVQNDRFDVHINGIYSGGKAAPYNFRSDWHWNRFVMGAHSYDDYLRGYFTGDIDEVRLYKRALSKSEILELSKSQNFIPEITSPTPGSTLSSSTETFEWTSGADEYWLWVGSSAGTNDIYNSGSLGRNTSDTVYNLPTDGSQVYVRLYYNIGSGWKYRRLYLYSLRSCCHP